MQSHKNPVAPIAMPVQAGAGYLGLGITSIYHLLNRGEIETVTVGRRRLLLTASLDAYIERKRAEQSGEFAAQQVPWEAASRRDLKKASSP